MSPHGEDPLSVHDVRITVDANGTTILSRGAQRGLHRFRSGSYNVSEAAYPDCLQSYEVTDPGMVMPR